MGDWTGTVPSYTAGDEVPASKMQIETSIETALTAAWTDYSSTVVLTNLTLGNGAVIAKYRRLGKTVDWRFRFTLGSTSAVGTQPTFTLPVTPHADFAVPFYGMGTGALLQAGVATRVAFLSMTTLGTVLFEFLNATPTGTSITATSPWTWATGHQFFGWGTYETA